MRTFFELLFIVAMGFVGWYAAEVVLRLHYAGWF